MKVLVAVASKHGSTHEIGKAIAAELQTAGHATEAHSIEDAPSVSRYEAIIVGSAAYMGKRLSSARQFASDHQKQLAEIPV